MGISGVSGWSLAAGEGEGRLPGASWSEREGLSAVSAALVDTGVAGLGGKGTPCSLEATGSLRAVPVSPSAGIACPGWPSDPQGGVLLETDSTGLTG